MGSHCNSASYGSAHQEICALTCYFNPQKFQSKKLNFAAFSEHLHRQRVELFVIELAFNHEPFDLPSNSRTLQVRSRSILWQKERLLNHLLKKLPEQYSKVVWLDCDVIFERDNWIEATAEALDAHNLVQPFTTAIRLPPGKTSYEGEGTVHESFGSIYRKDPSALRAGVFDDHGHTGFSWAARRDWLSTCGLYDRCLSGSGDHLMVHAFCGDWRSDCVTRLLHPPSPYYAHFKSWAAEAYRLVQGDVGVVQGRLLHLWHGRRKDRGYLKRNRELAQLGFDPARDLWENPDGCWEFTDQNSALRRWAERYFQLRQEDEFPISAD